MVSTEEDYQKEFALEDYLAHKYQKVDKYYHETILKCFHEFYNRPGGANGLKILEVGSGPVIAYQISAAPFASEIVLADLLDCNRDAVQLWVDKSPNAHDWTPFVRHVVQTLEGKGEEEMARREEQLRKVVKAVSDCNVLNESMLPPGYEGPYDIIVESSVLDAVSKSKEEYVATMARMSKYLKQGGWFLSKTPMVEGLSDPLHYGTGYSKGKPFVLLSVTEEFIHSAWKEAGFTNIEVIRSPLDPDNRLVKLGALYSANTFVSALKPL